MSHENTPPPGSASGQPDAEGPRAADPPAADVPAADVPAAEVPEVEVPEAGTATAAGPTRRARFAAWRRERPFAGGVLAVLSGLVLYFSGRLELDSFEIQLGIEGMQSTLLPVALVALGVLLIVQPQFRVFYGVITLAISVYSLLGVNLGGFGIGMVLGVVGGILAVSWMPRDAAASAADPAERPEGEPRADNPALSGAFDELLPFGDEHEPENGAEDVRPRSGDQTPARRSAAVAVVAAFALVTPALPAAPAAGAPQAGSLASDVCWDPLDWIESVTCEGDEAEPSPSPSATDDPADAGGEDAGTGDGAGDAGAGDDAAGSADDGILEPGDDGTTDGKDAGGDEKDGTDPGEKDKGEKGKDGDGPTTQKEAREDVKEAATLELGPCARITFGGEFDINISLPGDCGVPEDENVFSLDGELETRDLQLPLTGLNGISVVNVPVSTDGPRRDALKISVDSVKVPGFWLKTYALGGETLGGTVTNADYVSMEGNAQMYISSIHANLPDGEDFADLGGQIADGASLVEILLALVDARIGLMGATSDVQVWSDFREQVWQE
ncbi:DUF6114 domain-containing protein [Isoptericola cucumis]|uniref:Secreted protein n=1 Tax=Isoptericola cucumis TaxID=1776856 RepID=A0ABQ2BCY8_9MICO|nr:DUF6114 domain-containing protein [Isoptericola cucumis]GGI11505.1 hypothetical protein GCM10007368_36530 [Isoptericola cucumis]